MAGKILFDVGQVLRILREQWGKEKAICFWCLVSAVTTFTTAGFVFGETREAVRRLLRGRRFA